MLGYDFETIYKKGKQNMVVDALPRRYNDVKELLCALSIIQPDWIVEARERMEECPINVDTHSTTVEGSKCIRYFCVEE